MAEAEIDKNGILSQTRFSYQAALCVIPPEDQWAPIQKIRKEKDRAYERWTPHINLFFPFIEMSEVATEFQDSFDEFVQLKLQDALKAVETFSVKVDHFDGFVRKKDAQMFLGVDSDSKLQDLWSKIRAVLPSKVVEKNRPKFVPHMSVGQFKKNTFKQQKQEFNDNWKPFTWDISEVCLISRGATTPFEVKYRVKLGSK